MFQQTNAATDKSWRSRDGGGPHRRLPASGLVSQIRELSDSLNSAAEPQLLEESQEIRRELARGHDVREPQLLVAGLALACEALRRTQGVKLYDSQLLAAIAMIRRNIVQMQTGEGKTFVAIATALQLAFQGRGVHVVTPNGYLAARDELLARTAGEVLGMQVARLPERVDASQKTSAYNADITYGTGHEFGFDYLQDQLTLRNQAQEPPGERLLRQLRGETSSARATMQRGLAFAIVDEVDSVLIDDAGSPLILSSGTQETAPDAEAHLTAKALAEHLQPDFHFSTNPAAGSIRLTESGVRRAHASDVAIPVLQLRRPWTDYVRQALRARYLFRRDVHFVVQDGKVRIVDESTGRIYEDRSWQDGLHQAIEAFENLPITAEKNAVAQMTRQRFFRLYEHLCGMTGTAVGCEREFYDVYHLHVEDIPLRIPSQRRVLPSRFFATGETRNRAIVGDCLQALYQGRAVLIGTRSISESAVLAELLRQQNVRFEFLNGVQDADEADVISRAGQCGAVTIATNLAGRGTDIALHDEVRKNGGLHVIVAGCQTSSRMDRQLMGRSARQGDPGSTQIFVAADDALLAHYGPWLAAAICRGADSSGETHARLMPQLLRIQATAERQHYAARVNMLRRDMARDTLLRSLQ